MENNPQEQIDGNSDEEVLKRIRSRFAACEQAETKMREDAVDDINFCKGDQWQADVKTDRENEHRPCLTINRLPAHVRQVTNEQRQNRPAIKVNPVDDHADVETGEIIQGLIRHIEYSSNAEVAYDTAVDYQVRGGFGYFRLITEYADPTSFDQEIKLLRVRDPFSIYLDPDHQAPDGSDSEFGFAICSMSPSEYKRQWPGSIVGTSTDWAALGSTSGGWMNKDTVRVAEYYEKQYRKTRIYQLSDGRVVRADELKTEHLEGLKREDGIVPTIKKSRETHVVEVKWYKTNGTEILDKTDVFGSFIPIIPVYGDEYFVNGERTLESLIRHAKDPQRMYNYWKSAATEMIALAPKAPFIGVEGQFEDFEDEWKLANVQSQPYLQYKSITLPNGQPAPPPARQTYEPPVQALNQQAGECIEDIKATTGIFDAELGNRSAEQSGIAIQRRVNQSNTSNFHFGDNFKRSLRHAGCIILEWIPHIYNKEQAIRCLGVDNQQKIVTINKWFHEAGEDKGYFLDKGRYDVTIDTGPSFQTKRQEAVSAMMELTKALPNTMAVTADLLVRNMDWPEAQKIADRLKKALPPGIAEKDDDDSKQDLPPAAQQLLARAEQVMQQQQQVIGQQDEAIRMKKVEAESRERIEFAKMRNEIVLKMMEHDVAGAKAILDAELGEIEMRLQLLHENSKLVNEPGDGPQGGASSGQSTTTPTGGPPPG